MRFWKSVWWLAVLAFGSILWLGSAPAQSAEVSSQQSCIVKTVCVKPHKPAIIKPLVLDRFLYMCLYSEPLIIVLGADSIPLSLNVPDNAPTLPDDAAPAVVPVTAIDSGLPGGLADSGGFGTYIEEVFGGSTTGSGGGGYSPPNFMAAPEIDPSSAVSALTLLIGGLLCLRRTR